MATFANQLSFFFLIVSFACHHQIQARESKFFSKYRHQLTIPSTKPKVVPPSSPSPSPSPITSQISGIPASAPVGADTSSSPAPAPIILVADNIPAPAPTTLGADYSPTPAPSENDIPYYDLYTKDTYNEEDEFSTENPKEFNNKESYTYNNGYFNSLSNNNGFWTSNEEGYHNNNNGYDFNSGYKSEPQGMSDTRLQNEGRYYHDVEQENHNPTRYENIDEEGYYDGNYKKSKYEFDSMEEYEKQEGLADVEEEFIP